jgi:hypothetical protein
LREIGEDLDMSQIQQTKADQISECLTNSCKDCSGLYVNKLTGYKLECKCKCHNENTLEQRVVEPRCSNVNALSEIQQYGVLRND